MPEEKIKQQMHLTLPLPPIQLGCEASLPRAATTTQRVLLGGLGWGLQALPTYLPLAWHGAAAPPSKEFTRVIFNGAA